MLHVESVQRFTTTITCNDQQVSAAVDMKSLNSTTEVYNRHFGSMISISSSLESPTRQPAKGNGVADFLAVAALVSRKMTPNLHAPEAGVIDAIAAANPSLLVVPISSINACGNMIWELLSSSQLAAWKVRVTQLKIRKSLAIQVDCAEWSTSM